MDYDYLVIICIICGITIIVLSINYWIANCFYEVACMKGHNKLKYFWMAFLFGILGYFLIAILPDRKKINTKNIEE